MKILHSRYISFLVFILFITSYLIMVQKNVGTSILSVNYALSVLSFISAVLALIFNYISYAFFLSLFDMSPLKYKQLFWNAVWISFLLNYLFVSLTQKVSILILMFKIGINPFMIINFLLIGFILYVRENRSLKKIVLFFLSITLVGIIGQVIINMLGV
ncbi:hypothetical protein RyT2_02920 [Pseudolactococcus yaeyamensis]